MTEMITIRRRRTHLKIIDVLLAREEFDGNKNDIKLETRTILTNGLPRQNNLGIIYRATLNVYHKTK